MGTKEAMIFLFQRDSRGVRMDLLMIMMITLPYGVHTVEDDPTCFNVESKFSYFQILGEYDDYSMSCPHAFFFFFSVRPELQCNV